MYYRPLIKVVEAYLNNTHIDLHNTVKTAHAVTSIKQPPVLKGHRKFHMK